MQINIFEGARRVALLLSVIAVLASVGLALSASPYITANFSIAGPGKPLTATSVDCDLTSSSQIFFDSTTPKGRTVWIKICLIADQLAMDDGTVQGFIPLPPGPNGKPSWAHSYSPAVKAYERDIESNFRLPYDEGSKADREFDSKRLKDWKNVAIGLVIFLLAFWLVVAAIGWIVRGFMGIPRGKDARPAPGEGK